MTHGRRCGRVWSSHDPPAARSHDRPRPAGRLRRRRRRRLRRRRRPVARGVRRRRQRDLPDGEEKIQEITSQGQQELQQASSDKQRRDAVGDLLEQTAEEYRPYLDRLNDLEAPEDLADDWSNFVDGITEAFDLIPELADATRENDKQKLSELTRKFSAIAEETRPFAERAGLDDCLPDASA